MAKKTFYAVNNFEVVQCHLLAPKDRERGLKYAANSKRDKRRFAKAYKNREDAEKCVMEYETKLIARNG